MLTDGDVVSGSGVILSTSDNTINERESRVPGESGPASPSRRASSGCCSPSALSSLIFHFSWCAKLNKTQQDENFMVDWELDWDTRLLPFVFLEPKRNGQSSHSNVSLRKFLLVNLLGPMTHFRRDSFTKLRQDPRNTLVRFKSMNFHDSPHQKMCQGPTLSRP